MTELTISTLMDRIRSLGVRGSVAVVTLFLLAVIGIIGVFHPESNLGQLFDILTSADTLSSALRLSVPIAFAALGGIFAEKSGVINIGLEGLLIIAAFFGVYATEITGSVWIGMGAGVLSSTLLAALFGVVCIEFRADQIIAGLAVWLIALGLAPFLSQVIYNGPNTVSVKSLETITIPYLSEIPFFGALFDASPVVYLMFVAVAASWYTLNRTSFGRWVIASGENPKALDTAGVSVRRVRYAAVLLSGVLSGIGGAALSLSLGQFIGNGATMVNGKGFIAIVAYLFGNYNPIGAMLSTLLFAGLEAVQIALQVGNVFAIPQSLVRTIPYLTVVIVLALVGNTRVPEAAGDYYESGEE
ncbi:ribose ABC transporter permease [Halodesulfurarchaeum formicicum]|uniref:Ribose ABC transporter permease n=2 Tax=Halodesulfurarchaeum formicicum TaxID=1873524 RepID=A0A1D8S3R2_9EURY|nr:ribose ABC transporter permease [Halodesulfurarchaeum formicicum]